MPMDTGAGAVSRALTSMTPSAPITVALARFDDLLTLGLRALLADDPALAVVAQVVGYEHLSPTLADCAPTC